MHVKCPICGSEGDKALLIEQIKTEYKTIQTELDFHYQAYRRAFEALDEKLDLLLKKEEEDLTESIS